MPGDGNSVIGYLTARLEAHTKEAGRGIWMDGDTRGALADGAVALEELGGGAVQGEGGGGAGVCGEGVGRRGFSMSRSMCGIRVID